MSSFLIKPSPLGTYNQKAGRRGREKKIEKDRGEVIITSQYIPITSFDCHQSSL